MLANHTTSIIVRRQGKIRMIKSSPHYFCIGVVVLVAWVVILDTADHIQPTPVHVVLFS